MTWVAGATNVAPRNFTMGQIHSALAYYWDQQDEMDADIERRWHEVKQLQQRRELSPVEKRLKGRKTRE